MIFSLSAMLKLVERLNNCIKNKNHCKLFAPPNASVALSKNLTEKRKTTEYRNENQRYHSVIFYLMKEASWSF